MNPLIGKALISGGASLLSGILGNSEQSRNLDRQLQFQKEENQKNREYNLMLAQKQNAWNIEQWERENDYNSPEAVMERLRKGNVNPDLFYGGGASNMSASSPMLTSGAPSSPVDMSPLGQKPTLGQAIQQSLHDSMIGAQIENIKADTKKKENEASILESDAKFRDAINQGTLDLQNMQLELGSSELKLNDEQIAKFRSEVRKLDEETKNVVAEYGKIRATIKNIDADTASRRLHDALDSDKVEAEIKKLAASAGLDYANTKRITTLLSAELLGLQADTADKLASVSLKGSQQINIEATTENIRYDLSSAKEWSDIEKGTGVYGKIMQGLTPIANLIGIAIGSGALRGRPNKIGFH